MVELDLSGGAARELKAGGGSAPVPVGVYSVVVRETSIHQKEDRQSVKFICEVSEGDHAGGSIWIYAGLDTTKAGNKNSWLTVFASLGMEASEQMQVNIADFVGKAGFARIAPDRDRPDTTNKYFVTPGDYAKLTGQGAAAAPVAMTVTKAPTLKAPAAPVTKTGTTATASVKAPSVAVPAPKVTAPNLSAFLAK